MKTIAIVLALVAVTVGQKMQAIVVIEPHDNTKTVNGSLWFIQNDPKGPVTINGTISGLSKGNHGFHIHEKGDFSNKCLSTGGHYNPHNLSHGGPSDGQRHLGDLGNIMANDQGIAHINFEDKLITLSGPNSIIGRAVVVHSGEDDLGKGGHKDSLTTGNSGERIACGIVSVMSPTRSQPSSAAFFEHQIASLLMPLIALILSSNF
ncbi:hypothetical protein PV326_004085 [Microctonus aethiopoides]|nr:hypothetical protein PV326_004085 [Microctonus aethiopoides]